MQQWRKGGVEANGFVRMFGPVYLPVLGAFWASSLPAYFSAVDGVTRDGTPIGNLAYAAVCFVVAALCLFAATARTAIRQTQTVSLR